MTRKTCLSCGGALIHVFGHWSACPHCEAAWLKSLVITLPDMNLKLGGDLLLDKGVQTRNGRRYGG